MVACNISFPRAHTAPEISRVYYNIKTEFCIGVSGIFFYIFYGFGYSSPTYPDFQAGWFTYPIFVCTFSLQREKVPNEATALTAPTFGVAEAEVPLDSPPVQRDGTAVIV